MRINWFNVADNLASGLVCGIGIGTGLAVSILSISWLYNWVL